jgi:uncharacterized protein with von Willebrand factor type A (vWA) domain
VADDLAEVAARFGAALRQAGVPAGPGRCERFAQAVTVARPATPHALYLCALTTLVSSRAQIETLEAVFHAVFGGLAGPLGPRGEDSAALAARPARSPQDMLSSAAQAAREHARRLRLETGQVTAGVAAGADGPDREVVNRYLGSAVERLAATDFADLSPDELAQLTGLMRRLTLAVPLRRTRRPRRRRHGPHTDVRATLREARRTGGDPVHLIGRAQARRPRRLVVLCDISGSMEPYARAMIQLLYCAAGGARAEVFTFATRLTRLTRALAGSRPAAALALAGQTAPDWLGGTRIGASLRDFNDGYGRRGMARGAVVVIISDGWDTGDPAVVRREMERLSLIAYRIVWVNPRTKNSGYQPLAGGMAAAWPHCDAVLSGHTLHALDELAAALADPVRRRVPPGSHRPVPAGVPRPVTPPPGG